MVLFLVTLTSPRSHSGSAADGETREEAKANIPYSHNSRCGAYDVAGEEADESSCKAVALCADVEVAEREGAIAVVEECRSQRSQGRRRRRRKATTQSRQMG